MGTYLPVAFYCLLFVFSACSSLGLPPSPSLSDKNGRRMLHIQERISGQNLKDFLARTKSLNKEYSSDVITEFAYNGFGILEKVTLNKNEHD